MYGDLESLAVQARSVDLSQVVVQPGTYRDVVALGRGGMGDVHLMVGADSQHQKKLFVIKRLREAFASEPDFLKTFLEEARIAADLHHTNIARTEEVGFDGRHHFVAREYLDGLPLSELVRRAAPTGGLPLAIQLRILSDALAGLHHAHEQRGSDGACLDIVHRDFSPSNLFVLYDGSVKIVDFGIAKTAYNGRTKADVFKGKIQYVAPEQYASRPVDRRTDIYSAGVILWEAATQQRMWSGLGDLTVAQRVAAGDIPLPSSIEPGVPKRLEAICMRALSLRPEDRFATAAEFRAEIEWFLQELGEPLSAKAVGRFVAGISTELRSRLHRLVTDQVEVWRQEAAPVSLIPTVTSPRTRLEDLVGGGLSRPQRSILSFSAAGLAGILSGLAVVQWLAAPASSSLIAATTGPAQSTSLATEQATSPAAVGTPRGSAARKTRLTVVIVPSSARIGVDGSLLPPDTHDVVMPHDRAAHRVWAEAPGYQTRAEWVRLDDEQVVVKLTLPPNER